MTKSETCILVADDEADIREIIKDEFEGLGYKVLEAKNGREAFEILKVNKIDAIISDIRMPGGDGVELLDRVVGKDLSIPIFLFITGFSDLTTADAYDKGAAAVFSKPFDMAQLVANVERLLSPPLKRWTRKVERFNISLDVELSVNGTDEKLNAKTSSFGRGGMFIAVDCNKLNEGSRVGYRIKLVEQQNTIEIKGTGVVRWLRYNDEGPLKKGIGIEFENLTETDAKKIVDYIALKKPRAFIPKE